MFVINYLTLLAKKLIPLAPIVRLALVYHCGTLLGLKGPSLTFMDPQMDLKTDPARLISGAPW